MDTFCKLDGPDLLSHMMDLGQTGPFTSLMVRYICSYGMTGQCNGYSSPNRVTNGNSAQLRVKIQT